MDQEYGLDLTDDWTSREAQADTLAILRMHDGCIGEGFHTTQNCNNCRSDCKGRRDIYAFSQWGNVNDIASPAHIQWNTSIDCDRAGLPTCNSNTITSIMGYEAHCESYIASAANLDLAKAFIDNRFNGWAKVTQLWFDALPSLGPAFRVSSGGQCNPNAQVNGCGSSNWYKVLLFADDQDNNLNNGTPNGCLIKAAYHLHGIDCTGSVACHPE